MADSRNSKSFFFFFVSLSLLFLSPTYPDAFPVVTASESDPIPYENSDASPGVMTGSESEKQGVLLHRLEELVRNLTEVVARLDARLSETQFKSKKEINDEIEEDGVREKAKAFSVTKYSPFWSERFEFSSAVKLNSEATCINVLPFRDYEGLSKYFAVGDSSGRLFVFLRNGDVLVEFFTTCDSPITSMVSFMSVYKNESFLVTGHQSGVILLHRLREGSIGEDWNSAVMENVGKFDGTEDGLQVTLLEVHHVGRVRYILATDLSGKLTVFTENRTVYGSVTPTSRPLVFLKQRLLFLTETGAGSLDLRSMKIRESECEGLNHSLARSYVFDASERSKAYGFTSEGEIIHVLLLGDIMNFKCRVRSKKKFQIEEPVALQAIKGYLLVVNQEKVFVYNVSTQHYVRTTGPRLLFPAALEDIRSTFLSHRESSKTGHQKHDKLTPLIASDREKLLVMGLGDGYVATYKSKLPISKGEFNTMLWSSPVFFFILFLFGAWHFFAKKKESLTAWGPDDPFTSATMPSSSSTTTTQNSSGFGEPSRRNDDLMDLRRRYVSPTRYPPGAATGGGYRSVGSNDPSSRAPVETTNYRTTAQEMKYRGGSGLDSGGFGKRRESLFGNNKALDDEN
ncbi:putative membrane protein [Cardamine amara subsp. amara]|uniref:Membrane protein n=1 Tax=Cardamine amara subsp. amara TaxID=228776 RepID=A0ABD1BCP7_CARAN